LGDLCLKIVDLIRKMVYIMLARHIWQQTLTAADADEWLAQPASNGPVFRLTDARTLY